MEEINSLILYGCKLARDLELNLQTLSNQPNKVFNACDEIARVFTAVRDGLNPSPYDPPAASDLFRYGMTQAMATLFQTQNFQDLPESGSSGGGGVEGSGQFVGSGDGGSRGEMAMDMEDSSRGGSMQRPRRRKEVVERGMVRVPAPRMGNTEIPPDDGHTWRKYGQKEILGSRFPRSYYRCTHQKIYHCPAKKQVQRLDEDPFTFEVTYRGDHTCHMSATAPSVPIIPNEILPHQHATPQSPAAATLNPINSWLSMNLNTSGEGTSTAFIYEGFRSGTTGAGTSPGGACPFHVADLADAMFNTGTGGNISLDLIFSSNVGEEPRDKTK